MSPRKPRFSGHDLVAVLESHGFRVVRVRGSHHGLRYADGRTTVVPVHAGEVIGPGLLTKILRTARLTVRDPHG